MWRIVLSALGIIIVLLILGLFPVSSMAQAENPSPNVSLIVSFQQGSIKIKDSVLVTVLVSNQSDIPITNAQLIVSGPGFLLIHPGSCNSPTQSGPIYLSGLPPHSTTAQPVSLCLTLDSRTAIAGTYNVLTSLVYKWDQGSDLVSVEKPLQVDLIGTDTIVGIPLGFAGFILPGLMLLVALKWFSVPWVKGLGSDDRIIYGVILSLVLLGPFSWLATKPGIPEWITWLDFQQQVSIERLGIYTLVGLLIGILIGMVYQAFETQKALASKYRESLQIKEEDSVPVFLKKALKLNGNYRGKPVFFLDKTKQRNIYGSHYARFGNSIYLFASFQLILSSLRPEVKKKVLAAAGSKENFGTDRRHILAVLEMLGDNDANAFIIANPVEEVSLDGTPLPVDQNLKYMRIDTDGYLQPQYDESKAGCLVEILDEEP